MHKDKRRLGEFFSGSLQTVDITAQYTHTHTHTHTHTKIHTYIQTSLHAYMHTHFVGFDLDCRTSLFFSPGLLVTALLLQAAPLAKRKEKLSLLTNLLYQNVFWLDLFLYFVCVCVCAQTIHSLWLQTCLCPSHSSRYFEQICSNQLPLYCRFTADVSFLSLFRADMQQRTPAGRIRCIQFFRGSFSMPLLLLCRLLHSLSLSLSLSDSLSSLSCPLPLSLPLLFWELRYRAKAEPWAGIGKADVCWRMLTNRRMTLSTNGWTLRWNLTGWIARLWIWGSFI